MTERPSDADDAAWKTYWESQGQPWRTEPEIDVARQSFLAERHMNKQETSHGTHPFVGLKLVRADIEWMLGQYRTGNWSAATWEDNYGVAHQGLDFYGVDVSQINLSALPLQDASFCSRTGSKGILSISGKYTVGGGQLCQSNHKQ